MVEAPVGWQCAQCVHRDSRRAPITRWRPKTGRLGASRVTPMVAVLIAVNVIVYLWQQSSGVRDYAVNGTVVCRQPNIATCRFAMWPAAVHTGQWYRLLTAPFLHANITHILFNMLTLLIVGSPVEAELGKLRFLAVYFVSALGGSVASYLLSTPNQLGVGASGAIFGLMGSYFVLARRRGWDLSTIGGLIVVNLVIGFASTEIDWRAHIGGLVSGAVVTLGMLQSMDLRSREGRTAEVATAAGSTIAVVAVLVALTLLPPGHVNL
jgi:membrane associated rhomboid family serine protease